MEMAVKRKSGIELLRVLCIVAIIAHHYYVHGLTGYLNELSFFERMFFQSLSMFGRSACSVFVIISGFFMVKKDASPRRLFPLFFEMLTYSLLFVCLAVWFEWGGCQNLTYLRHCSPFLMEIGFV